MSKRKFPFGYHMEKGQICIHRDEASLICGIFEGYIAGKSYKQLTNELNNQSVSYSGPDSHWNKNAVARLLQNQVYTGEKGYPPIITKEIFNSAGAVGRDKRAEVPPDCRMIRSLVSCSVCGEKMEYRWRGSWSCPKCDTGTIRLLDASLRDHIQVLLLKLVEEPSLVQAPNEIPEGNEAQELYASFEKELDQDNFDEASAKALVMALTAAQFNALGSTDYETMRIHRILERTDKREEVDMEVMRQITSAILLHPDGRISLKLKNGQAFGRSIIP